MFELPTSIDVGGKDFRIRNGGDFRLVLDCLVALDDYELDETERILACLIMFYEDLNSVEDVFGIDMQEATSKMFRFFNCGDDSLDQTRQSTKLIDWKQDELLIVSAVNNVAGKEIRAEKYVHWWTFMGWYMAVGESPLSTVVAIRDKIAKGKKLEKYEQEFRRNNPGYFVWKNKSAQDADAERLYEQLIKKS